MGDRLASFKKGITVSILFNVPEVDDKATAKNVLNFFNDDVDKLERQAGISISSPRLDITGGKANYLNSMEDHLLDANEARKELAIIKKAIQNCPEESQKILEYRYFQNMAWLQIEMKTNYSDTTIGRRFVKARLDFADEYAALGRDIRIMK
ncbi:hypothetical protein FOL85_01610 [Lactobacillus reuteri]|uniref:ArpU family phage packaging/lysis transcriptional regulator n=1 Tax=Limosilactobacillus reuteri TaxID=1598 RepID=UPI00146D1586|nr:ArpU family phage packaging/lysis transcriptional regulator [Limosilactobacillus reuteri]NMV51841.1 hypothetical protein [Limosilactobacillus reuteri]NMV55502.1 hypothetical protein [Limosilactobacillus reuteri]NMV65200.1 hypothetical protein [Limosilactobacillus reuteri]